MQKIIFVITKSNWGGAQRYVFDLATALPKHEWLVTVAMGGTGLPEAPGGKLEQELRHRDIRTVFIRAFMRDISLSREWRALRELWDFFAKEQPDIVHLNSSKAGGLGALAARLAGVPHIVFTSHGLAFDEDRNPLSRALVWLSTWATFLLCHKVILISRDTFARAHLPFCARKLALVHNGIAEPEFFTRDEARAKLELTAPAPSIGAVGELTWNKSYPTLIRAMGELKRRGKEAYLCVVGEGEERHFLELLIEEEGVADRVLLVGFVDGAARYMPAFDIYTLPSIKEGLPYVLLEAGAAGLPVVASNVGGIGDIIVPHQTGLLAKPKDHNALANHLEELLDKPELRKKYGEALREHVQKEFSLQKMVEQTVLVYNT